MARIHLYVISERDAELGKEPLCLATRELPIPSIGDILQIMVSKEDPWGFTGWMTIKVFEVRWFLGAGREDLLVAVYGAPDRMEKPPSNYSLKGNKIIWSNSK